MNMLISASSKLAISRYMRPLFSVFLALTLLSLTQSSGVPSENQPEIAGVRMKLSNVSSPEEPSGGEPAVTVTDADYDLLNHALCATTIIGKESFSFWGVQTASGDVNGDSIADFIIGGNGVDTPDSSRIDCGAVAVYYGSTSFVGDSLDMLAGGPDLIIYGASDSEFVGEALVSADVNDDGVDDIIIGAPGADGPSATKPGCGRVYIIFGGLSLPDSMDLDTDADVTIYGAETGIGFVPDMAGNALAVGKIDGDMIPDILINSPGADGSGNTRADAGEYYILYGGASWPPTLDLAGSADVTIVGADLFDGFYNIDGTNLRALNSCGIGDFDGDGANDLAMGFPGGDGRNNSEGEAGEVRVLFGTSVAANVDLLTSTDIFIYGADPSDVMTSVFTGDLDNDSKDDILITPLNADGLFNSRELSGELYILYGRAVWDDTIDGHFGSDAVYYPPVTFAGMRLALVADLDNSGFSDLTMTMFGGDGPGGIRSSCGDALVFLDPGKPMGYFDLDTLISDAFVFGGATVDRMGNLGISSGDINNDGYNDLLIGAPLARYSSGVRTNCGKGYLASGRMISVGDRDGDGYFGCLDNCPTLSNSSQADIDGDGVGDDCDNCPFTANSDQTDFDSDGVGDLCDNCPSVDNPLQTDSDLDGLGNLCDNCKGNFNPAQIDDDGDSYGNDCDPCPFDAFNTCCILRGDTDNSGDVNVGDAVYIVEFIFQGGPAPVVPGSGDPDCSGDVNIGDATFLVDYIFSNGVPPCCMP